MGYNDFLALLQKAMIAIQYLKY